MPTANVLEIRQPNWLTEYAQDVSAIGGDEARMAFVVEAARRNIAQGGGPFAAAVFESGSGKLVSLGVNLVMRENLSILHAEVTALAFAQRRLRTFDLGAPGLPAHELVSSAEPCAMCLGAVPWSGVRRLVVGARTEDVEASGFDEGAKPTGWIEALKARGVETKVDVGRAGAAAVIRDYAVAGGRIYNPSADRP